MGLELSLGWLSPPNPHHGEGTRALSTRGNSRSTASLGLNTYFGYRKYNEILWKANCSTSHDYTDWMHPFEACVTEIFIFSHSGWYYRCSVTLVLSNKWEVLMRTRPLVRKKGIRAMMTPFRPLRTRLIHNKPELMDNLSFAWNYSRMGPSVICDSNPMLCANPLLKNFQSYYELYFKNTWLRRAARALMQCFLTFFGFVHPCHRFSVGFRGGPKGPGPPTMFMCLAIRATRACNLVIFSEKSLFVDAINYISVGQTAVFHLKNIWYCDETTFTLIGFLKVDQVSESSECKAKPGRKR